MTEAITNLRNVTSDFLEAASSTQESSITRTDEGAVLVGKYGIPLESWSTWAAAAGYPQARWTDPAAQERIALWAVNTLYDEFDGNWALVAVAWHHGPDAARQVRNIYGSTPGGDLIESLLSSTASKTFSNIMGAMQKIQDRASQPDPVAQPGRVDLKFTPEGGEPPPQAARRTTPPARNVLIGVLSQMAEQVRQGFGSTTETPETQQIGSEVGDGPQSISAADTEHLNG